MKLIHRPNLTDQFLGVVVTDHSVAAGEIDIVERGCRHELIRGVCDGVEDGGQAMFRNHLIDGIGDTVGGVAVLRDAVELEAPYAKILNEVARFPCSQFTLAWIYRCKRDNDVAVLRSNFSDFVIADSLRPNAALAQKVLFPYECV